MDQKKLTINHLYWQQQHYHLQLIGSILFSDLTMHWEIKINGQLANQAPIHGQLTLDGNRQVLSLSANTTQPFSSHCQASLYHWLTKNGHIDLSMNWHNINWPANQKMNKFQSSLGKLTLHGTFNHYQLALNTQIRQQNIPPTQLHLRLTGHLKQLHIDTMTLKTLDGLVTVHGHITWQPNLKWALTIDSKNIDLGIKWPNLSSNLNFTAKLQGQNNDISLKIISLPLTWLNITVDQLTIHGRREIGTTTLNIKGQASTQNGYLTFKGQTNLLPPFETTLHMLTHKFLAMNTPHYKITTTANLDLTYQHPDLTIQGTFHVPLANINRQDFEGIVTLPDNITYIDEKKQNGIKLYLNINLLINKLIFYYQGLYAELKGNLTLKKNPQTFITATGTLITTHGYYQAYGRKLIIDKGQLFFAGGPITNPGINVRAIRNISSSIVTQTINTTIPTLVGIKLEGTLKKTNVDLFSKPNVLSKANILSYLLFGHGLDNTNSVQEEQLLIAASSFGFSRTGILQSAKKALGLSTLGLKSEEIATDDNQKIEQNTSFVVGKRLTPRLSIKYSIGLIKPVNILNIIYQLNKNWQIQTDRSVIDSGIDVLYTIATN